MLKSVYTFAIAAVVTLLTAVLQANPTPIGPESFQPKIIAQKEGPNRVTIERSPSGQLPYCEVTFGTMPVKMLFDTGATHTTLDVDFVKEAFPEVILHPLAVPNSNVQQQVYIFKVPSMTIGTTTVGDFYMMATDLKNLALQMKVPVRGIVGLNVMQHKPFLLSLGTGAVTWSPLPLTGFTTLPKPAGAPERVILPIKTPLDKTIYLLLDSGASYTFVPEEAWEASDKPLLLSTTDVNSTQARQFMYGVEGPMDFGGLAPTVTPIVLAKGSKRPSLLGADILSLIDIYVDVSTQTLCAKWYGKTRTKKEASTTETKEEALIQQ